VYGYGTRRELSFSPGQHTRVPPAEVYAIKEYAAENIDRGYRNTNIYLTVKLQLKHSTITRSIANRSGTVINALQNWQKKTQFN
jgi:hypothetical protein